MEAGESLGLQDVSEEKPRNSRSQPLTSPATQKKKGGKEPVLGGVGSIVKRESVTLGRV